MVGTIKLSLSRPCGHARGADVSLPVLNLIRRWRRVVERMFRPHGKNVQYSFSRMGEPQRHLGILKRRKILWTLPIKPEMVQPAGYSLYFAITHHNQNIITKEWKQCY